MDFSLGGVIEMDNAVEDNILPNAQSLTIAFVLRPDDIPEGTETFQVSSSALERFPTFESPTITFSSATISILDNDCEYNHLS